MRSGNGKKGGRRLKLYLRSKYHNSKLPDRVGVGAGGGRAKATVSYICTRITYIIVLTTTGKW